MADEKRYTVCLNMIVRNEGRTIRRLLESVQGIVEEYVIVDTGSTDDTVAQIKDFPLKGMVLHKPFVNFGVSRTFALEQARLHSTCDYLLMLDADMELRFHGNLPPLTADAYYIAQRQGTLLYDNIRLLRRDLDVVCIGATHEFYQLPPESTKSRLPHDVVFILDHGDGGSKDNKFERDLQLLLQELREDPTNPRHTFYLAQTLFDSQRYVRAINMYMQRIALGGWEQEVVYSKFRIALCHMNLQHWREAQEWTLLAQKAAADAGCPRAEPAYYMCKALREHGRHDLAYYFLLQAQRIPKPPADAGCLFVEEAVYDYLLEFERCILWYYVHPSPLLRPMGLDLSLQFLDTPGVPDVIRKCVLSNLVFYVDVLSNHPSAKGPIPIHSKETMGGWRYSTPGFLQDGTVYTRIVNYVLTENGSYHTPDGAAVANGLMVGNIMMETIATDMPWRHTDVPVTGLEDTRILQTTDGDFYTLSASREYAPDPSHIGQVLGKLDLTKNTHTLLAPLRSPFQRPFEKNWVAAGSLGKIIYEWYPNIWVGRIDMASAQLVHTRSISSPPSFAGMRGSTNGVFHGNLWWFVTHYVVSEPSTIRRYFHRIVALDENLAQIKHASPPFVFEPNADVEYCLGFRISENGIATFGYSTRDRNPQTLEIPLLGLVESN